jgi:biopolymer transport protein ExbD
MAYRPSFRRTALPMQGELEIRPVMNLMVCLIPILLQGAELVKFSVVEIDLPPTSGGGNTASEQTPQLELGKKLGLKLAITKSGFSLATASAIMSSESGAGPTIPAFVDGKFDYVTLNKKLVEIKNMIANQGFKDKEAIVITASADINYQTIIDVLDVTAKYKDASGTYLPLFPQVNFGQVIM